MEEMENLKQRAEKITKDANQDTKGLRGPLATAIAENKELKRQMSNYDRDKASLAVSFFLNIYIFINNIDIKITLNLQ